MEWEKIFATHILHKVPISELYKWAKDQNRHFFSKEDIKIDNRYLQRCSASLMLREMEIEATVRFHFTPVRMAPAKETRNSMF